MAQRARTRRQGQPQLAQAVDHHVPPPDVPAANRVAREVDVQAGPGLELPGILTIPPEPTGVVAFAQGSGSSRMRAPERAVARALNMAGIATLLFDLLTIPEEADQRNIFNIGLLTPRLVAATN